MTCCLAIDIGASSGRHILGSVENGKIVLTEIYRFENGIKDENGTLVWDIERLLSEVKNGLKKCREIGKIPKTIAIDTWGVDYVLLDENKKEIFPCVSYRDKRTDGIPSSEDFPISAKRLYNRTGIQTQDFNTIYQLWCDKKSGKLENARHFLMMPDYLSFKLTGKIANEYTNATTTGLVNAESKGWDKKILSMLDIDESLFLPLCNPGTVLGEFSKNIQSELGFNSTVIFAPSHDTASAVAACPLDEKSVYISSGTWSLVGTENTFPVLTSEAQKVNFTNEGGAEYRFRFLENIMGMWLFQNIRKELGKKYTYDEMMIMAMKSDYKKAFSPNLPSLVAPESMLASIRTALGEENLSLANALKSVYISLAKSYDKAIKDIEKICRKQIENIIIVGGGSKDKYLNRLTSEITGKKVFTGLSEATALGNIAVQIMYDKKISLTEARQVIKQSFDIKECK